MAGGGGGIVAGVGANVLVDLDCHAKLSDFGCSKRSNDTMSHTMRGSIPWMAPEVIKNTGYGRKADIWSFGCVVIEMATAKSPWGSFDNPMAAMCKIAMSDATPPIPEGVSPACQDFIGLCTRRDPADRPDATTLLAHEVLRNVCTEDD
ncbi:mkkA [Symbiodinium pilosum]|uniref:MkkA protein n=1 Tax=Symbiodinium pilosum TaxID=2952 RepID=A0A812TGC5_SYMPI|nr:mkkA [Symbiodinium pilosum]